MPQTGIARARVARIGFVLASAGVLLLALSPMGYRMGWFDLRVALLYLTFAGVGVATVACLVCLVAAYLNRSPAGRPGLRWAAAGFVLSALAIGYPVSGALQSRSVPRIHDITTDTANPPQFVALAAARQASPNGLAYGGESVAAEQRAAYPDIGALQFALPPERVFAAAELTARDAGWEVAAVVPAEGRIEATATTRLYGFEDDVVIRITPIDKGSRLDMRSASRVGVGDIGTNAKRIRAFAQELRRRLS